VPGAANLVGHWTFDEGAGTTAADSSGKKNNGTITNAQWVVGHVGGALKFSGNTYVTVPPTAWPSIDMQLTVAFWAFGDDALGNNWGFYAGDSAGRLAGCHIPWGGAVIFDTTSGWERIQRVAAADEVRGQWHLWTFVKNADSGDKKIYLDGKLWHSGKGFTSPIADVTEFNIGGGSGGVSPYLGLIDDFRLYDRALSPGEVAGLAGVTVPFDKPF
jgi:hypothetical protein